jgi:outer membrane immunogenic protein
MDPGGRPMRRMTLALLAASALSVCTVQTASAGPAAYDWTGIYLGANAGYLSGSSKFDWQPGPDFLDPNTLLPIIVGQANATLHPSGLLGGATAGYNYQAGSIVLGAEIDFDFVTADKTRYVNLSPLLNSPPGNTIYETVAISWLVTARPRVGFAANGWLFFVTGGLAVGKVDYSTVHGYAAVSPGAGGVSSMRAGWTVGGGIEYALKGQWTLKAEYLYADLGSASFTESSPSVLPKFSLMHHDQSTTVNIARLGINYRFGAPR